MDLNFEHVTLGQRVLFGSGSARKHLLDEVERIGAQRVLVLAAQAENALADELVEGLETTRFDEVAQHVPVSVAERARGVARDMDADLLVSIGGGSTTGLAKAVALTTGIPIVAVPTTYAGSEATNVWGMTEGDSKTVGVDDRVLPITVIYDALLTRSLPVEVSIASGFNAIAHGVDAMWAPRANPINQALSTEGLRALAGSLPRIYEDPTALGGRAEALYGTYLVSVAFASAGSGMHHKICHVLGGTYGLPHAQTHAIVLPYVVAYNGPSAPEAEARIAGALGARTATAGLEALRTRLDAPRALRDLGLAESELPDAARRCLEQIPESNPREITQASLETLLRAAWQGANIS